MSSLSIDSLPFSGFAIAMILVSMLVIMLFLLNILIAQLSTTYEAAKENARLEFDISKALFVTRLENSRFRAWVSSKQLKTEFSPSALKDAASNSFAG